MGDEEVLGLSIGVLVVKDALCGLLVAPSSTTLLRVALKTLGRLEVDDKTHIMLVDAHTERYGGYNDLYLVPHPLLLDFLTSFIGQLSMIVVHLNVMISPQVLR